MVINLGSRGSEKIIPRLYHSLAPVYHVRIVHAWRRVSLIEKICYNSRMATKDISSGIVHEVPADLREALTSDAEALAIWEDLTPLARNEWICWTISVKKPETRKQHVERVCSELKEGMRRPCCWIGCIHRTDKSISPSVQYVLNRRAKKSS